MRSWIMVGGFIALGLIFGSIAFGFELGLLFSAGVIVLAACMILYTTSAIQHNFSTRQYVAASLCLFAAVALLFWYIVRILIHMYAAPEE
jgi:FtsH-binding integral membrane protein